MSIVHGGLLADGQTLVAGFIAGILKHELVDSHDSKKEETSENVKLSGVEVQAEEQVDKHGQLQADQNEEAYEKVEKAVEEQQEQHAQFTFRESQSPRKDNQAAGRTVESPQTTGEAENFRKRRTSSIDLPATPKLYQPPSLDELMEQLSAADPPPQHEAPFPTTEVEHDHAAEVEDPRLLNLVIGEPGIPNDDADPIQNLILATDLGEVDTGDFCFEASEAQDLSTFDKEAVLDESIRLNSTYIVEGVLADGYPLISGLTFGPSDLEAGHAKVEQAGFEEPIAKEGEVPVKAVESEKPLEVLESSEKPSEEVDALLAAYDYKPTESSPAPLAPVHSQDFSNEIQSESGVHEAEISAQVHGEEYPKALEAIKIVDEQEKELSSAPNDPEDEDELVAAGEEAPHIHRLVVDPVGDALSEFGSNTSLKSFDPNQTGAGTPPELVTASGIAEGIKFHATTKLNEYVIVGGLQTDGLPLIQGIQSAPTASGEIKEIKHVNPEKIEEKTEEKQENPQGNKDENNDETTVTETTEEFHTAQESLGDTVVEEEGFVKLISTKSESRDGQQAHVQLHETTPVNAEDIQIKLKQYDNKADSKVEPDLSHASMVHKSRSIPIIIEEGIDKKQEAPQEVGELKKNVQSEEDLSEIKIRRESAPNGEKARQERRVVIEPLERWASEEDLRAVGTDQSGQVPEKEPIQFGERPATQRADEGNVAVLNGQQPTPTLPSGQNHSERVIPILIQSESTVPPARDRTEQTVRTVQPEFSTVKLSEPEGRESDSGLYKFPTGPTDQTERVITTTVIQNTQIRPEEENRRTVQNFDSRTSEGERNVPIKIVPAVNASTLVVDLPSPSQESGFHSTNVVSPAPATEPSSIISSILRNLKELKMTDKPKYDNIVERLRQLEEEMRLQNTGVPPDAQLTELVGKILQSEYPHSDLQIVVSASRKSTSHTQFYETETPGMVGLAPDQLRELQTKLMDKISGRNDYGKNVDAKDQPDDLKRRDANEEGWTNEDGTESVHKRTVRQITTTESSVKGVGDHPQPNE